MKLDFMKLERKIPETKTIENKTRGQKYENRNSWNWLFKMQ